VPSAASTQAVVDTADKSTDKTPPQTVTATQTAEDKSDTAPDPTRTRVILFIFLLLLVAITIKVWLLIWHRRHKKKPLSAPVSAPAADTFDYQFPVLDPPDAPTEKVFKTDLNVSQEETIEEVVLSVPDTPVDIPSVIVRDECTDECAPAEDKDVIESGSLSGGKVPALLKRCADLPEPAILEVRKGAYTKRVYFAAGQIAHASPWCTPGRSGTHKWNKLSYLLVREGLISETERDQAMEALEQQPDLHLGEILIKRGSLDLSGLRQALNRQTKLKVFSLILFPEGLYQVLADDSSLPAEESVSLEVTALIREASHHKAEWTSIRKALPDLDARLDFLAEGRGKLEQVRMSVHQQLLLSQIDGQQSIGDLCATSTIMDYEIYRFLFLMVKAGVLVCK
jgi:hypothetical protein